MHKRVSHCSQSVARHRRIGLTGGKQAVNEYCDTLPEDTRNSFIVVTRGHEPWEIVELPSLKRIRLNSDSSTE